MIEHVALGMVFRRLAHLLERQQEPAENQVRIGPHLALGEVGFEIEVGILVLKELLQLAD